MPIKKDKRKKKITLLKQKQKQSQKQQVVINLGDLMKKHRPRAKPLVPPKPKQPHELILTRVIQPTVMPPYQHHNQPTPVVTRTREGLEQPPYVPENYNPIVNQDFLAKMGPQPTPFQQAMEQTKLIRQEEQDLRQIAKTSEFTPGDSDDDSVFDFSPNQTRLLNPVTKRYIQNTKANRDRLDKLQKKLSDEEMERRRRNEAELFKQGGYKSQDE
jgi:hypothetical protein